MSSDSDIDSETESLQFFSRARNARKNENRLNTFCWSNITAWRKKERESKHFWQKTVSTKKKILQNGIEYCWNLQINNVWQITSWIIYYGIFSERIHVRRLLGGNHGTKVGHETFVSNCHNPFDGIEDVDWNNNWNENYFDCSGSGKTTLLAAISARIKGKRHGKRKPQTEAKHSDLWIWLLMVLKNIYHIYSESKYVLQRSLRTYLSHWATKCAKLKKISLNFLTDRAKLGTKTFGGASFFWYLVHLVLLRLILLSADLYPIHWKKLLLNQQYMFFEFLVFVKIDTRIM